jgi:dihydrofolate reductase
MTEKRLAMIAAVGREWVIGSGNALPWRLPADLRRFKALTMGKAVIMGRKTYESIGRPLAGRRNIVLTRQAGFQVAGCIVVHSLEEALAAALESASGGDEIMIIGGARLFTQMLPQAQRLYLTFIDAAFEGDAYFPALNWSQWEETWSESHAADEENPYPYRFAILDRRSSGA